MLCPEIKVQTKCPTTVSVAAHAELFLGLSHDEALREAFVARPQEMLAAYGIYLDPTEIPETVRLPGRDALALLVVIGQYWQGFFR